MLDLVIHKFANWGSNEIFILREDLLPFGCGGNKVRIVLKLIEDAKQKKADTIVGYGNSRSNMCRVLSMICAANKFKCVIVSPSDDDGSRIETTNSALVRQFGAEIVYCQKGESICDVIQQVIDNCLTSGRVPYYIFGDKFGKGNEHVLQSAYEEVANALLQWSRKYNIHFDRIALAVGTGSTYGGLLNGFRASNSHIHLMGYTIARDLKRCVQGIETFSKWDTELSDLPLGGGYGLASLEECLFLRQIAKEQMVLFDKTYAGKALWGLYQHCITGAFGSERILFIHTGSLPLAIDDMKDSINVVQLVDSQQFTLAQYEALAEQVPRFSLRGEALTTYLEKMISLGDVYVLMVKGGLLGIIGFYANDIKERKAYLSLLVVDKSLRGSGAVNLLFDRMRAVAIARGMCRLEANVIRDNARALRYYEKQGLSQRSKGRDEEHILISGQL